MKCCFRAILLLALYALSESFVLKIPSIVTKQHASNVKRIQYSSYSHSCPGLSTVAPIMPQPNYKQHLKAQDPPALTLRGVRVNLRMLALRSPGLSLELLSVNASAGVAPSSSSAATTNVLNNGMFF